MSVARSRRTARTGQLLAALVLMGATLSACFHGGGGTPPDPLLPTLSINDATGNQYDGSQSDPAVFTVTLSAVSSQDVTVDYTTEPGSATEGQEYADATGTATIPAGSTTATITVQAIDFSLSCSGTLTFVVNLSNPTNATIADGQGAGTILDTADCP